MTEGMAETRGLLMRQIADRQIHVDTAGCNFGRLVEQRVGALEKCSIDTNATIKEIIRTVDTKMNWVIMVGILLSFLAGINVWEMVMKLFVR